MRDEGLRDWGLIIVAFPVAFIYILGLAVIAGMDAFIDWLREFEATYRAPYSNGVMMALILAVPMLVGALMFVYGSVDDPEEEEE